MINYYKNLISEQEKRKKRFKSLKESLSLSIVPSLSTTIDLLVAASQSLDNGFSVDGEGADADSIIKNATNVTNIRNKISGSVIAEIDSEISKCDSNIWYYRSKIQDILDEEEQESGE